MRTNFIIILILSVFSTSLFAQNEADALRFSQSYSGGTARSLGLSGAFGALGGDPSSLSINPAGIGVYRSSEFTITAGVNNDLVTSKYRGYKYEDFKNKFNLSNLAYVYTYNTNKTAGWVSASFGVAYNRLADFNRNFSIRNDNATGSLMDEFVLNSNNNQGSEFYEDLAWNTDVLLYDEVNKVYSSDFTGTNYGQTIKKNVSTKGGIGEYDFSFGANFSHLLYVGATLGVQRIDYEEIKEHSEFDDNGTYEYLKSFSFNEHFNAYGTGVNFKIGAILKPVDFLRLGLAVHTRTYYNMNSEFYTSMESSFDKGTPAQMSDRTDLVTSDYKFQTPMKAIGSIAFVFDKFGLFSLDYEMVDYTKGRFRSDEDDFGDINVKMSDVYKKTSNIKAGLEGRLGPFAARVGYGWYGSPYVKDANRLNSDYKYQSYSAGIGIRGKKAFFDVAYVTNKSNEEHKLFLSENAQLDINQSKIMATLGFRF